MGNFVGASRLEQIWTVIKEKLSGKVDKVSGKGLSTNDYTTAEKDKLAGIAAGANKTIVDSALSGTSTNPVQNKIVNAALDTKVPTTRKVNGKELSTDVALAAADVGAIPATQKGTAGGVAELDTAGKIPSAQLPSFVDDVIDGYYNSSKFYSDSGLTKEIAPEAGKIYIDISSDKTYRWSGSAYRVISETIALGETSSTAYRGDWGKVAYDHSQTSHAPSNAEANVQSDWNATDTANAAYIRNKPGDMQAATASAAGKAGFVPAPAAGKQGQYLRGDGTWATPANTTYGVATQAANGLMSSADKKKLDEMVEMTAEEVATILNS